MRTTRARSTDPETSHEAAERLTADKLTVAQARVLAMFRLYGPMHDAKLVEYLHSTERSVGFTKVMSPSGARSRRSELSKPNMERLKQIADAAMEYADNAEGLDAHCRAQLRREGFRSPLIDSGRRVLVEGARVIVWELAV